MNPVDPKHLCLENGYFCPYMDGRSGLCIATNCRHAQELLYQAEVERQAKTAKEIENGKRYIQEEKLRRIEEDI